jgi:type I restriction enzyme S subunit
MMENISSIFKTVPPEWEWVKLGNIFQKISMRVKDFNPTEYAIPILSMTRKRGLVLQSEKFDKRVASKDLSNYKIVRRGQLVYGFPIDEGVISIQSRYDIGAVSPAYQVWNPMREFDDVFMDYFLKTPQMVNIYKYYSSNVVERRRNLSPRDFVCIRIPLPPLPEQRAIANVLTTVRKSIEATESVIAATRELKCSMMKYLFTYGTVPIDQLGNVILKKTDLGEIPEYWDEMKIGELAYITKLAGYEYSKYITYIDNGEMIALRALNMKEGKLELSNIKLISKKISDLLPRSKLHCGDIVMSYVGTVGELAIIDKNDTYHLAPNVAKMTIIDSEKVNNLFLVYYLMSPKGKRELTSHVSKTSQPVISMNQIRNLKALLPDISEQKQIALYLKGIDEKIAIEVKRKSSLESLFTSMLVNLMEGKIRIPHEIVEPFKGE